MARVTVEDCIEKVTNRYELVVVAARRAKDISAGAPLTVDRDNDKDAVVALREIADGTVKVDALLDGVVQNFQQRHSMEKLVSDVKDSASEMRKEIADTFSSNIVDDRKDANGMSFGDENVQVED